MGVAQALNKPIIVITQRDSEVPFILRGYYTLVYDRIRLSRDLVPHLADAISIAFRDPQHLAFWYSRQETQDASRAFVSYSHADRESLERLLVHLKPLQKQGGLDVWADTNIKAGDNWEQEISDALARAAIAVLLISADFLGSDFIVDNELPPLLQAAREKGTRILPVILKPCRFGRDETLSRFQAVNPPSEPLLSLSLVEQERVWDEVAYTIETEIGNKNV